MSEPAKRQTPSGHIYTCSTCGYGPCQCRANMSEPVTRNQTNYLGCTECSASSSQPVKSDGQAYRTWRNSRQVWCRYCEKFTVHKLKGKP